MEPQRLFGKFSWLQIEKNTNHKMNLVFAVVGSRLYGIGFFHLFVFSSSLTLFVPEWENTKMLMQTRQKINFRIGSLVL